MCRLYCHCCFELQSCCYCIHGCELLFLGALNAKSPPDLARDQGGTPGSGAAMGAARARMAHDDGHAPPLTLVGPRGARGHACTAQD